MKLTIFLLVVLPLYAKAKKCNLQTAPGRFDTLKVTWKNNVTNPSGFSNLPRTVKDALAAGWVLDAKCSDTKPFLGNRYVKDGDTSAMVLFDKNGFIAGLQAGIPKNLPNNYPTERQSPPLVEYKDQYVLTAYFVEPSRICSHGRSAEQFNAEGTGNGIWFQNSTNPLSNLVKAPALESRVRESSWTKGKCYYSMGMHYWYNVTGDMDCQDFQPFFLLYNYGHLDAFGWLLAADLPSVRYEKPPLPVLGAFIAEVPTCVATQGQLSSMHVFLSENAVNGKCEDCTELIFPNDAVSLRFFSGLVYFLALLNLLCNLG